LGRFTHLRSDLIAGIRFYGSDGFGKLCSSSFSRKSNLVSFAS
jgi:hypothetical protein